MLFALRNDRGSAYFLSGVLFGLALLMKQPGLFFFLFGAAYILYHHFSLTRGSGSKTPLLFPPPSPTKGDSFNPTHPPLNVTPPPSAPPLKIRGGRGSYDLGGEQRGA